MPYGFRYPHEKGSIVSFGCFASSLARKMAPSQIPGPVALSNALTEIGRAHVCSSHTVISYAVFCLKKKNPERDLPKTRRETLCSAVALRHPAPPRHHGLLR